MSLNELINKRKETLTSEINELNEKNKTALIKTEYSPVFINTQTPEKYGEKVRLIRNYIKNQLSVNNYVDDDKLVKYIKSLGISHLSDIENIYKVVLPNGPLYSKEQHESREKELENDVDHMLKTLDIDDDVYETDNVTVDMSAFLDESDQDVARELEQVLNQDNENSLKSDELDEFIINLNQDPEKDLNAHEVDERELDEEFNEDTEEVVGGVEHIVDEVVRTELVSVTEEVPKKKSFLTTLKDLLFG